MIRLSYIDTIKYEAGYPTAVFLLADEKKINSKKVVIFGTGIEAYTVYMHLKNKGIRVHSFVNNDWKMSGKMFCGCQIVLPEAIWDNDFYVVVAMSREKYMNEVLWQLKVHGHGEYGVAFIEKFHFFNEVILQDNLIKVMNQILCDGKEINEIVAPGLNVGASAGILRDIPELCWTTTWSHWLWEWFYEEYLRDSNKSIDMLEIGPGKGVFSGVVHKINGNIRIKWLMFDMDEQLSKALVDKYNWYPANMFETYCGIIEDPKYHIEEKFDVIVMTEVMEHFVLNPIPTLKKIAGMLKENGKIYISTPNWGHLMIYDDYKQIPDYTNIDEYRENYIGHSYQYSKAELEEILMSCDLQIEKYAISDSNNHNLIVKRRVIND